MTDQVKLRNEIVAIHKKRFATKKFDAAKRISAEDWLTIMEAARLSLVRLATSLGNFC